MPIQLPLFPADLTLSKPFSLALLFPELVSPELQLLYSYLLPLSKTLMLLLVI
jgi:hypothetical protein